MQKTPTRIVSITNHRGKNNGYHFKAAWMRKASSRAAVSAYIQAQVEDALSLLKLSKSECPDIWIRLPRHKWPKSWSSVKDRVVPLERNLCGHPLAGLLWERQFEKVLLEHGWEEVPNWECLFVHLERDLFLSVCVDDTKLAGKTNDLSDVDSIQ